MQLPAPELAQDPVPAVHVTDAIFTPSLHSPPDGSPPDPNLVVQVPLAVPVESVNNLPPQSILAAAYIGEFLVPAMSPSDQALHSSRGVARFEMALQS